MERPRNLVEQIADAADRPGPDLAAPAFLVARLEYPQLDPEPYLDRIDRMGVDAAHRIASDAGLDAPLPVRVDVLNTYLFTEVGFTGNREQYDDPRNSCLNEVLDRRTGIPITLALIYIEVARRSGVRAEGINFPGHFLVRVLQDLHTDDPDEGLIVDPFHGGAILGEADCRSLLHRHMGEEAAWAPSLLARATRKQILIRMLLNLKRLYVRMRSFPQARFVSTLLLTVDPSAIGELRDRGLLAYHLEDFASALRDLEEYLRLAPNEEEASVESDEESSATEEAPARLLDHVKALRRRVAGFN
jgi:regulator of sirC expression with transglutaminase-like and TPR domain